MFDLSYYIYTHIGIISTNIPEDHPRGDFDQFLKIFGGFWMGLGPKILPNVDLGKNLSGVLIETFSFFACQIRKGSNIK